MSWNPSLWLVIVLLVTGPGCTATRTREFTREAYEPAANTPPASRSFDEGLAPVRAALVGVLARRGAAFEQNESEGLVATIVWADAAEAAASVDLGGLHRVITRTERAYRSWSLLHFRCDPCVVRHGDLISQKTELVEDKTVRLDPGRYRLEVRVRARFEGVGAGTRLELGLELSADPPEPVGVLARSTGHLEAELFDALEAALLR